ncbi:MAG: hypothetical protein ACON4T_09730 [Synechococcus sp.]
MDKSVAVAYVSRLFDAAKAGAVIWGDAQRRFVEPSGCVPGLVTAQKLFQQSQTMEDPTDMCWSNRTSFSAEPVAICEHIRRCHHRVNHPISRGGGIKGRTQMNAT